MNLEKLGGTPNDENQKPVCETNTNKRAFLQEDMEHVSSRNKASKNRFRSRSDKTENLSDYFKNERGGGRLLL